MRVFISGYHAEPRIKMYFFYFKAISHVMGYHDGTQNFTIKKYDILAFKWRVLSIFSIPGSKVIPKNKRTLVKCPGLYLSLVLLLDYSVKSVAQLFDAYCKVRYQVRADLSIRGEQDISYPSFSIFIASFDQNMEGAPRVSFDVQPDLDVPATDVKIAPADDPGAAPSKPYRTFTFQNCQ